MAHWRRALALREQIVEIEAEKAGDREAIDDLLAKLDDGPADDNQQAGDDRSP